MQSLQFVVTEQGFANIKHGINILLTVKQGTSEIFWNVIVLQEKSQSCVRNLNRKHGRQLVCDFVTSSRALIFSVIGHNTINVPEIF